MDMRLKFFILLAIFTFWLYEPQFWIRSEYLRELEGSFS